MYNGPIRKQNRLNKFDYSSNGGYFLTFCTKNRIQCFGNIIDGKMVLNELGKIVEYEILHTKKIRKNIEIDEFIIMPDHIHLVLFVVGNDCIVSEYDCIVSEYDPIVPEYDPIVPEYDPIVPKTNAKNGPIQLINDGPIRGPIRGPMQLVPTVIKGLKSTITKQINEKQNDFIFSWQKSYYDRIIRNEDELNKIRNYIINNPLKWDLEKK